MEKQSKGKKRKEKDTNNITKILETIKDRGFIQELCLDVMSDIKEKPSYIRLKDMVDKVIKAEVDNYATKPKNDEERSKTRTVFSQLSIMTYTIDTLISEVIRKKLNDEFKSIISNIISELKDNAESPKVEEPNSVSMLEGIGEILCNGIKKESTNQPPITAPVSSMTESSKNADKDIRDTMVLNAVKSGPEKSTNMESNVPLLKRKIGTRSPSKIVKHNIKKSSSLRNEKNSDVDIMRVSDDEHSVDGNLSFRSISSVHTSDLSSFEDDISISSEDEDGVIRKKHVPLKLANDLYAHGRLSDLYQVSREDNTSEDSSKKSLTPSIRLIGSPSKRLSSRAKKPNLKYSSDDVLCTIKQLVPLDTSVTCVNRKEEPVVIINEESKTKKGRPRKIIPYTLDRVSQILGSPTRECRVDIKKIPNAVPSSSSDTRVRRKKRTPFKTQTDYVYSDEEEPIFIANVIKRPPVTDSKNEKSSQVKSLVVKDPPFKQSKESVNSDSELKRKKHKASNNTSENVSSGEQLKHSFESFLSLEERLFQKTPVPQPKTSKQSYKTSDLYKPRSVFRSPTGSRKSKAITLFSN